LLQQTAPLIDALLGHGLGRVLGEGYGELGLAAVEIEDLLVGLESG